MSNGYLLNRVVDKFIDDQNNDALDVIRDCITDMPEYEETRLIRDINKRISQYKLGTEQAELLAALYEEALGVFDKNTGEIIIKEKRSSIDKLKDIIDNLDSMHGAS